ncbi:MAG: Flp family type IVb pilin [Actinomycetota bacterium]
MPEFLDRVASSVAVPRDERGATAVEYSLILALVVLATVASIAGLRDTSGDYLSTTGEDIGTPRERIADMDDDLPDPPAWLP